MLSLASLAEVKYSITSTGIQFHEELTFDEWNAVGERIAPVARTFGFVVGDWINYGMNRYGDKYAEAMVATKLAYETLAVYSHVARCVQSLLRNKNLDFHHHKVVAKIKDPEEQRRWLELAESDCMSVKRLRKSINAGRALSPDEANQDNDPSDRGHVTYLSSLNEIRRWWKRETDKAPVRKWDKERRSGLKEDFRFVVDIYEAL